MRFESGRLLENDPVLEAVAPIARYPTRQIKPSDRPHERRASSNVANAAPASIAEQRIAASTQPMPLPARELSLMN